MEQTLQRPRLNTSKPRRAPGIMLADVTDDQIIALLDAGLSRVEIAHHFGVQDHIVRYRIGLMRERKIIAKDALPYRLFFVDEMTEAGGDIRFFMIPAHRRSAWAKLKAIAAGDRPTPPLWAVPVIELSNLEFSTPKGVFK